VGHVYADRAQWDRVSAALWRQAERGRAAGLDSEFYGLDIRKQSCAGGQSKLHLWSVAVNRYPLVLHPRGYYAADAAVLTADALEHRGLREWLESDSPKCVHNLPVDAHTFANRGIHVGGAINTLARARFCWPERARGAGFDLDGLGTDMLGLGKTESFADVFTEHYIEVIEKVRKMKRCTCGEDGCRKRKGHEKVEVAEIERIEKPRTRPIPLESVLPGHERWERAVAYAARDALVALYLNDRMDRVMEGRITFPWLAQSHMPGLSASP
jgi:hypothetical protein